jgi:hypothetical protein
VEGKVLVGSLKESATVLWQTKEEGEMLEDTQGLFHSFEGQSSSEFGDLFLPALAPVLKMLIRELWVTNSFPRFLIGLPLTAVPEEALHYVQRLRNTLAEKRGQEGKGLGAGFAEIAFYPNYPLPTPSAIKTMPNDLIFISSLALWTDLFSGKVVIFSSLSIILDRDSKIVYDHSCWMEPLKAFLIGLSDYNPEPSSRAFLLIRDLSY